jgi:hypothetical protein
MAQKGRNILSLVNKEQNTTKISCVDGTGYLYIYIVRNKLSQIKVNKMLFLSTPLPQQ